MDARRYVDITRMIWANLSLSRFIALSGETKRPENLPEHKIIYWSEKYRNFLDRGMTNLSEDHREKIVQWAIDQLKKEEAT